MLKASLRFSAAFAIIAISLLVALLYLPATNHLGKQVIRLLGGDHIVHVLVAALLPLSLGFLARLYLASKRLQWAYWLACLTVFAGDELLQGLSPLRESDLSDFMMSTLGWLIGCCLWWLLWLLLSKRCGRAAVSRRAEIAFVCGGLHPPYGGWFGAIWRVAPA